MKNIIKFLTVVFMAATITACNSDAKMQAYKNSKKIQDSLKLDSFKRAEFQAKQVAEAEAKEQEEAEIRAASRSSNVSSSRNTVTHQTVVTQEQKKKGWSSAAKGAVIGAGAGAVTGIIVDKKDGRGAVIGGVVGAGTGYVIGRQKDKKTGRAD